MGWDGLIVQDESVDVVDLTREFAARVKAESCGQCFPCRMGTERMADILDRICAGRGTEADLIELESLAHYVADGARCDIGQTSPKAILDALACYGDDFREAVAAGVPRPRGTYVSMVTAPCINACPTHVDIPGYVDRIRADRWDTALSLVRETCCLPGTIGRVCVRECESHCRRATVDEPISIKALKRYIADQEIDAGGCAEADACPTRLERVAIIGAGPAGLSCAYYLALRGYPCTIFEALPEPGGMAAVGIPDYRLPRDILRGEVARVESLGVEIRYGVRVGVDVTLEELTEQGYQAVFIAAGAPGSSLMGCEGEDACYLGYMPGVEFLRRAAFGEKPLEGDRILVVGGGNVAMDCVRTAAPDGLQPRRAALPAHREGDAGRPGRGREKRRRRGSCSTSSWLLCGLSPRKGWSPVSSAYA